MEELTSFEGRTSRSRFWILIAAAAAAYLVAFAVDGFFTSGAFDRTYAFRVAATLFLLVPGLSILVRRFHDRDKPGWWVLIGAVPVLGLVWLMVELGFLRGTAGPNRFGPDPLAWSAGGRTPSKTSGNELLRN